MRHLAFFLIAVSFLACRNDHAEDLPAPYRIRQNYSVTHYRPTGRVLATATFQQRTGSNSAWENLLLSGNESITFNGDSWTSTYNTYTYKWDTTGITDVTFGLTKESGDYFSNVISLNDLQDIAVDTTLDTIPQWANFTVRFTGPPVASGEIVFVYFTQGTAFSEPRTTTTPGDTSVAIPSGLLNITFSPGPVTVYVTRSRTYGNVLSADGDAGGKREISKTDWRTVILN